MEKALARDRNAEGGEETLNDYKEMRIDLKTFRLFLGEVRRGRATSTSCRTVSRSESRGACPSTKPWRGSCPLLGPGEARHAVAARHRDRTGRRHVQPRRRDGQHPVFFELHSDGRPSLTKDEVLRLSEALLFFFRNEPHDGYLGAVSQLIAQAFEQGGEGSYENKA